MPWRVFFCTWGVTLVTAFLAFAGYFWCKLRGQSLSVFYAICPALLLLAFFCVLYFREIIYAFT